MSILEFFPRDDDADHLVALFTHCHATAVRIAQYVGDLNLPDTEEWSATSSCTSGRTATS